MFFSNLPSISILDSLVNLFICTNLNIDLPYNNNSIPLKQFLKCGYIYLVLSRVKMIRLRIVDIGEEYIINIFQDSESKRSECINVNITFQDLLRVFRGNAQHKTLSSIIKEIFPFNLKTLNEPLKLSYKNYYLYGKPDFITSDGFPVEVKFYHKIKALDFLQTSTYAYMLDKPYGYLITFSHKNFQIYEVNSNMGKFVFEKFKTFINSNFKQTPFKFLECSKCHLFNSCPFKSKF